MNSPLISVADLKTRLTEPDLVVVDCRHSLADVARGRRDYLQGHIPGAVFAHLDDDLSGEIIPGKTGRHPLPPIDDIAKTLSNLGIDERVEVVVYDDFGGAIAARLWWMLLWLGHDKAAVLDGGFPAWTASGGDIATGMEQIEPRSFQPRVRRHLLVNADQVDRARGDADWKVIDSRGAPRYRGETEPIDPVAGHIPGALNLPFAGNLNEGKTFLPGDELASRFRNLLGETPVDQAVFYCGSGVTAAHNLLALKHAGLGDGKLYAGSWSEWITDSKRPVATN
ncbi:MAG: sulfurtransferase [Acidobacteriota bacterium]|nr:sulfurtransferase [Acidobacteriota bacterium]